MRTCPRCAAEIEGDFAFCPHCGAELAAGPTREQRKTVTVLFCDVSGSTALGERLETEAVREVMLRYFDEMRVVIERHSGTVEKFIGDAVMAVFGVPVAHEDDALRAVRAAAEMVGRMEALNNEFESRFGARIGLRIGVNTGEVVAGDPRAGEAFVSGDAVNFAITKVFRAQTFIFRGDLAEAEAEAREALAAGEAWGTTARFLGHSAAFLAEALMEQGKLDDAAAALARAGIGESLPDDARLLFSPTCAHACAC